MTKVSKSGTLPKESLRERSDERCFNDESDEGLEGGYNSIWLIDTNTGPIAREEATTMKARGTQNSRL